MIRLALAAVVVGIAVASGIVGGNLATAYLTRTTYEQPHRFTVDEPVEVRIVPPCKHYFMPAWLGNPPQDMGCATTASGFQ